MSAQHGLKCGIKRTREQNQAKDPKQLSVLWLSENKNRDGNQQYRAQQRQNDFEEKRIFQKFVARIGRPTHFLHQGAGLP